MTHLNACLCAQAEAGFYRGALVTFLYEGVYCQTTLSRLFAESVWFVQESFLPEEFSVKMGPTKLKKSQGFQQ